jgi:DNA-binding response OmpR family regulator
MIKNPGRHIVIADDEPFILSAITDTLSDDYDIFAAANGKSALSEIKKNRTDMVILDVMMPEMDGIEVVRYMKNDRDLSSIPIILLTAKGQIIDIEKGFKTGIDAYIVKPFSPARLIEKIEEIFERDKMREKISGSKPTRRP